MTEEYKVKKFDEIIYEYQKLIAYRENLACVMSQGVDSIFENMRTESGGVIQKETRNKFHPNDIRQMQQEIVRIDLITDFIKIIIHEGPVVVAQSKINEDDDYENQHNSSM